MVARFLTAKATELKLATYVALGDRYPETIRVLPKYDAQCPHIVVVFVRALLLP